jgi:hypothetical protein
MPKGRRLGQCYAQKSATPPATQRPSVGDLRWVAGFLEGEGHFRRTGHEAGGNRSGTEIANAAQQNLEPLLRLKAYFGGTIRTYQHPDRVNRKSQKPCSTWSVSGARARGVLLTIYALMSARRKAQIRAALQPPSPTPSDSGASNA